MTNVELLEKNELLKATSIKLESLNLELLEKNELLKATAIKLESLNLELRKKNEVLKEESQIVIKRKVGQLEKRIAFELSLNL